MLNYIWAGLIIFSLVFALARDVGDIRRDTYRNGAALPAMIAPTGPGTARVTIDPQVYRGFYGVSDGPSQPFNVTINSKGTEVRFAVDSVFPKPLSRIRDATTPDDDRRLAAEVVWVGSATALRFQPVRFQTMNDIAKAAVDAAKYAVTLALGLIGVIALWLGLTRIGEKAGLIAIFNKLVRPFLRPLFPDVPKDHPAMGFMALNLTANILGMGNAATPMGLKAMEELQTLNPKKDTATNAMVMLLAMHASSLQLLPPVMVIAVMGLRATNALLMPIWIATAIGLAAGIIACLLLGKLPMYQRSDPQRRPANGEETVNA